MFQNIVKILCAITLLVCTNKAQGKDSTAIVLDSLYWEFMELNESHSDDAKMYGNLEECYRQYSDIITNTSFGDLFNTAQERLKILHPALQNAAVYYSKQQRDQKATFFARAYVDLLNHRSMSEMHLQRSGYYPTLCYFAASNTFNAHDYEAAINYYSEYLNTGEPERRKKAFIFLNHAYTKVGRSEQAYKTLQRATAAYPNDFDILSMAINAAMDRKDYTSLSIYLDKALVQQPDNMNLLSIQGKMLESQEDFESALLVYNRMRAITPNSMSVNEHIALNTYNLAVLYHDRSVLATEKSEQKQMQKTSRDYFSQAAPLLQDVIQNQPDQSKTVQYLQSLAIAYNRMGRHKEFGETNQRLLAMGGDAVVADIMPVFISEASEQKGTQGDLAERTPFFSDYAKVYIDRQLRNWTTKNPYETQEQYEKRVNPGTLEKQVTKLRGVVMNDYIKRFSHTPTMADVQLGSYDAENQTYLLKSIYGPMLVHVPVDKNEAESFRNNWRGMEFQDPKFTVSDGDTIILTALTIKTPTGKTYSYDNSKALTYNVNSVAVDMVKWDGLISSGVRKHNVPLSDVDVKIPQTNALNENTYVVVIANEDYTARGVRPVQFALHDGEVFAKYCEQTLGVPPLNIRTYFNADYGAMVAAMDDIKKIAKTNHNIQVIFYYAGHGFPDPDTKSAYLLPTTSDGKTMANCYSLNRLYSELAALEAQHVVGFFDACFSGAFTESRSVMFKPKEETPKGRMIILSAASGAETAYPYQQKSHGLFTYFLLKKLQETKGNVTLKELTDYVKNNVYTKSQPINKSVQTPTLNVSPLFVNEWEELLLR